MKDTVKLNSSNNLKLSDLSVAVFSHLAIGILGFIASRVVILGSFVPFGISFLSGCPICFLPSAAIGVFLGYILPATSEGAFRYLAALFAVLAIKLLLSSFKKLINNPLFLSFICILSVFLTSAVTFDGVPTNVLERISEAILSSIGTYFMCRAFSSMDKSSIGLNNEELACMFISLSILICGFSNVNILGISLGNILGIALILTASKFGGVLSGAVSGIAFSFISIISGDGTEIIIGYAFGGLMAGVFASYTKYAQIMAIIVSCVIAGVVSGNMEYLAAIITEVTLGAVIFLIIPITLGNKIGKFFSSTPKISVPIGLKKSIVMRLCAASNALKDVSLTVERVSEELSKINTPDFSEVLSGIEHDACAECKLRIHCWETKKNETLNAILEMSKAVKRGVLTPESFATDEFRDRCIKLEDIGSSVYKRYSEYTSRSCAENRIEEVRSVISDQFNGISSMLNDLAKDFEKDEQFDNSAALTAASALKNIDIIAEECSSRIDKYGRMTLELKVKNNTDTILNKLQMMRAVSSVCERSFDIPSINEIGNDYFITFTEQAIYSIDIGVHQITAENAKICGDAYSYFYDSKGHFVMVLSDGMGTGGRAAVDGAMASGLMARLIKAGFGFDCSLKILNSSMLFKSTDESLATVDIASIDLFTGATRLLKAGAAPTLVLRSGRTGKAESTSLPAGILRNIGFDKATLKMKAGDIVIMMSDGATSEGTDWIRSELEAWADKSAQSIAEHICECAKRRRKDSHQDDITIITAKIEKA